MDNQHINIAQLNDALTNMSIKNSRKKPRYIPIKAESNSLAETKFETCKVKKNNTDFFVEATEKTVKLKKGNLLQYIMFGNQGLAVVKAKIGKKWVKGEILLDDTTCN